MPRSDFRHDATVGLMRRDLRSDLAGEQFPPAQDGNRRFVAGGFNRKNERAQFFRAKDTTGRRTQRCFLCVLREKTYFFTASTFGDGLLGVNHHALERIDCAHHLQVLGLDNAVASAGWILSLLRNVATARSCSGVSGTRMFGTTPLP